MKRIQKVLLILFATSSLQCVNNSIKNPVIEIAVANYSEHDRGNEIVTVNLDSLRTKDISNSFYRVYDSETNDELISQTIDWSKDSGPDLLIFQAGIAAKSQKKYTIKPAKKIPACNSKVYATFVPEHNDNFSWENDRIAYRMYGPAAREVLVSSGIDVWTKRVPYLIVDKWYRPDVNYHEDTGEGGDFYNVGTTCGCGGSAILFDDRLFFFENFTRWKILANGPLRIIFELTFDEIKVGDAFISETKRITLDAGQQLNKVQSRLQVRGNISTQQYAVGIVKHESSSAKINEHFGFLQSWESLGRNNGYLGCALIGDRNMKSEFVKMEDHYLVVQPLAEQTAFEYHFGAVWSKAGKVTNPGQWSDYLETFMAKLQSPIQVIDGVNDDSLN